MHYYFTTNESLFGRPLQFDVGRQLSLKWTHLDSRYSQSDMSSDGYFLNAPGTWIVQNRGPLSTVYPDPFIEHITGGLGSRALNYTRLAFVDT